MKILVVNGSPKGKNSITLQTVHYINKYNKDDDFEIINAGQQIKSLEKDFSTCIEKLKLADVILFSYPVYTFIVPAQLHRFVELVKENFKNSELSGKYATQITTSKHFFDVTAHDFINENCRDLGLRIIEGLSADMEDLTSTRGQKEALDFWRYAKFQIEIDKSLNVPEKEDKIKDKSKFRVSLICDIPESDSALRARVEDFKKKFPYTVEEFNLQKIRIDGGCISCFNCSGNGQCIYKDGFSDLLRNKIINADAQVYAFTISNHSMGSKFKYYDDRNFCNGHRTMTMDKPVGYIINGDFSCENNLKTIIYGRASVGHNILTHIATDEKKQIDILSKKLTYVLENPVVQPQNFYGIGGMKIFRDLISVMGGLMTADYKFYKSKGFFKDFPTKQKKKKIMMKLVGALMHNPKLKKKAGSKIDEGMLMPYTKILNEK